MSGRDTKAQAAAIQRSAEHLQPTLDERLERIENLLFQLVEALREGRPVGRPA